MELANMIASARIKSGEIGIFWIGQAGFLLKDHEGNQFAIDLYLTDCGERKRGFKRISPKLIAPWELMPDYYFITHTHFDHFDYDAIPIIASKGKTIFLGPESCMDALEDAEIPKKLCQKVVPGEVRTLNGVKISVLKADHGTLAPDALGVVVEMGGHRIYFSGDTAYWPACFEKVKKLKPDVAVISINGKFGNMNAIEGAKAAIMVGAKIGIPCHFWTFAEHGGNPLEFKEYLENEHQCQPVLMQQGEMLILKK